MNQINTRHKSSTEKMVMGAILTALVVILQLLATFTTFFGPFSTAVALIPIVIGAATCGTAVASWLGFVFGAVVLLSGNASLFWGFDVLGTIITVMVKGTLCGTAAGITYNLLKKINKYVAVFASAIICPVVNTGIFLLGSAIFFLDNAKGIAETVGSNDSGMALFIAFAFGNFIFEIATNAILSPTIVRLLNIKEKQK